MSLLGRRVKSKTNNSYCDGVIVVTNGNFYTVALHIGKGIDTLTEKEFMSGENCGDIKEYEGKGFYIFQKQTLLMFYNLGKLYPNTKIFRELYPEGNEFNGFWEVL